MKRFHKLGVGLLLAAVAFTPHAHARAENSAELEPDHVAPGERAMLRITTEAEGAQPDVPQAAALRIQHVGQQSRMSSQNGVVERSVSYLYQVSADTPGDYRIDGITVQGASVPAPTLHVTASGTTSRTQALAPPPPTAAGAEPQLAALRFKLDKQRMYAGQSIPFSVQAYFRGGTGVTLKGRPELSSDTFTVSGLDDEPTQAQIERDGVPYLAVTWRGTLTAVKPGELTLGVSMPVNLEYRDMRAAPTPRSNNRLRDLFGASPLFDSMFNDPFFDSFLDQPMLGGLLEPGRIVQRELTLRAQAGRVHVLPLPERGRPEDFSGAIGQFELQVEPPATALTQGEPVDLRYAVQGRGNFGQFRGPTLAPSNDWKAYDASSKLSKTTADALSGKLQYLQPLAAVRDGQLPLPALTFSYFDPETAQYVTRTAAPAQVHVAAAPMSASRQASASAAPVGTAAPDTEGVRSLEQAGVPGWLWPVALVMLTAAGLLALVVRLARSRHDARWSASIRRRKQLRERRRALQLAVRAGDAPGCVHAARSALQQQLSAAWGMQAQSITLRELDERWPTAPAAVRRVFELADAVDYAGQRAPHLPELHDLTGWARQVDSQLTNLEVPR